MILNNTTSSNDKRNRLVTVIVPAYNHERYIIECLESIHKQTFCDFQWIVVDDCSKDNTPKILIENQKKYGYQLILNENNKGLSQTLTDVIKEFAVGKYLSLCASDDYWCESKLDLQVRFMESHPDYAMCYGQTYNINVNSQIIGVEKYEKYRDGMIFEDIITQRFHPPVNYMIKKEIIQMMGYFKGGVIAEDFYMNCLISHDYPIGYIPEILGYYRIAELQTKRDPYSLYKSHEDTINMFRDEKIYPLAYSLHCMRCFVTLSMYKKYKILSLKYAYKTDACLLSLDSLRAIIHLIRYWK